MHANITHIPTLQYQIQWMNIIIDIKLYCTRKAKRDQYKHMLRKTHNKCVLHIVMILFQHISRTVMYMYLNVISCNYLNVLLIYY